MTGIVFVAITLRFEEMPGIAVALYMSVSMLQSTMRPETLSKTEGIRSSDRTTYEVMTFEKHPLPEYAKTSSKIDNKPGKRKL